MKIIGIQSRARERRPNGLTWREGTLLLACLLVLASPAASVQIHSLGDSNVLLRFYAWIDQTQSDYSAVRSETIRRVKAAFQQADFDMPEPIYRLRIGDQGALFGEPVSDGATQGILAEEPTAESPEPLERSPEAGESPEAAARSQLPADERSEEGHDNLLREDAPKE